MSATEKTRQAGRRENEELCVRLAEAEETLAAIRRGAVDAVVVSGPEGEQLYREVDYTYRRLVEEIQEGALMLTPEGVILYSNRRFGEMLETPLARILGAGVRDFIAPADRDELEAVLEQGRRETARVEIALRRRDGLQIPVYLTVSGWQLGGEAVLCGMVTDLREQKRMEQIVAEERLARAILEQATEAVVVCDPEGTIIRASRVAHQLCERNPLQQPFAAVFPLQMLSGERAAQEESGQAPFSVSAVLEGERFQGREAVLTGNADQRLILLLSATPLWGEERQILGCVLIMTDITQRKQMERDHALLTTAIEQTDECIIITDPEGIIQYVNPRFETTTGYTRQEALGQTPRILKSGKQDAAFYRTLWQTISSGNTWRGRIINQRKDGTHYTETAVISPVNDAAGRIINYVALKQDITAYLRMEAQFHQAQKTEAMGRLASGVAHDFNNQLTVIIGYAQMTMKQMDPAQPLYAVFGEICMAAQRSANLTQQLLAFARQQVVVPRVLDLNEAVEGLLKMLRRLISEDIDLAWLPEMAPLPVKVDPSQIDQILANLCVNARDAIDNVGQITIETESVAFDEAYCDMHPGVTPGEYVLLSVSDDGYGIDQETLAKIFDPFFTTKSVGQGTGLGLATVYGIVEQNDGFIHVYSELGQGTAFKIYLPRHMNQTIVAPVERVAEIPPSRGETVLVVEDDISILNLNRRILEEAGYTVLAAGTPGEAMRLAEECAGKIHLLITDVVLPEMNGRKLAEQLRSLYPNLKYLFMSGYTANVIAHRGVLDENVHFLPKPFSPDDLLRQVRTILDQDLQNPGHGD